VGGNRVLVLSHDPSGCCSHFRDLGVELKKGDLARPDEWKDLLRGCAGFYIITPGEEVGGSALPAFDCYRFLAITNGPLDTIAFRTELNLYSMEFEQLGRRTFHICWWFQQRPPTNATPS
jgi:hypothetical protein